MEDKALKKKNKAAKLDKSSKKEKKLSATSTKAVSEKGSAPKKFDLDANKDKLKVWFKGIQAELKKIIWPTKDQLIAYTVVVFVTLITTALYLWLLSNGFAKLFNMFGIA